MPKIRQHPFCPPKQSHSMFSCVMTEEEEVPVPIFSIVGASLGIASSTACFCFIAKKLKINHVIRKLLLFGSVQQIFGYGMLLGSTIAHYNEIKNKLTCFIAFASFGLTMKTTQALI